jgi:3-oxoacyl-[acyl-carrier protein] reductase
LRVDKYSIRPWKIFVDNSDILCYSFRAMEIPKTDGDDCKELKMEKVALVTGSTNNIGKAIGETLSRNGYHVVITSRHEDEAKEVSENLPSKGSFFRVDFSKAEDIRRLFDFIKGRFKRLSVLVNNVAYTKNESILDCDLETWQYTIDTNLRSYYLCSKYAAEIMKENGGGNIINVTVSSTRGVKGKFSYMVSKGGVNFLTMSAAVDLAPYNIRVNAVGSGMVGTPVGYREYVGRPYKNDRIPIGHIGSPEDIAEAVAFLVSEKTKYILGGIIPIDGGLNISH